MNRISSIGILLANRVMHNSGRGANRVCFDKSIRQTSQTSQRFTQWIKERKTMKNWKEIHLHTVYFHLRNIQVYSNMCSFCLLNLSSITRKFVNIIFFCRTNKSKNRDKVHKKQATWSKTRYDCMQTLVRK